MSKRQQGNHAQIEEDQLVTSSHDAEEVGGLQGLAFAVGLLSGGGFLKRGELQASLRHALRLVDDSQAVGFQVSNKLTAVL